MGAPIRGGTPPQRLTMGAVQKNQCNSTVGAAPRPDLLGQTSYRTWRCSNESCTPATWRSTPHFHQGRSCQPLPIRCCASVPRAALTGCSMPTDRSSVGVGSGSGSGTESDKATPGTQCRVKAPGCRSQSGVELVHHISAYHRSRNLAVPLPSCSVSAGCSADKGV